MSIQVYDADRNLVGLTDSVASPDQQVADQSGLLINPAKEDGNLASVVSRVVGLTYSSNRLVVDGSQVNHPVTKSGTWTLDGLTGSVSLPTGAATENTLAGVKTQTDKLSFTPINALQIVGKPYVKFSETFTNDIIDTTNRWSASTSSGGASAILNNILTLSVNTTASSFADVTTLSTFGPTEGNEPLVFRACANFGGVYDVNNVREFGLSSAADTFLFRLVGTTLNVVVKSGGVEVVTAIAVTLDANWHLYEIKVTAQQQALFYIDRVLWSTKNATTAVLVKINMFSAYFHDGNTAITTTTPSLQVVNIAINDEGGAGNFISVLGQDSNRIVRTLAMDPAGRVVTTGPTIQGALNVFNYQNDNIAPYLANLWRKVLAYSMPAGYTTNLLSLNSLAGRIDCASRVVRETYMGSYNIGTQSFSQGNTFGATNIKFAMGIDAEVTVALSAAIVTLTMTYTNQSGAAGHTATCTFAASDVIGTKRPFILQAGDFGVKAITAMSRSAAVTGTVLLYGIDELCYHDYTNILNVRETVFATNAFNIAGGVGGAFNLELTGNTTTSTKRKLTLTASQFLTVAVVF